MYEIIQSSPWYLSCGNFLQLCISWMPWVGRCLVVRTAYHILPSITIARYEAAAEECKSLLDKSTETLNEKASQEQKSETELVCAAEISELLVNEVGDLSTPTHQNPTHNTPTSNAQHAQHTNIQCATRTTHQHPMRNTHNAPTSNAQHAQRTNIQCATRTTHQHPMRNTHNTSTSNAQHAQRTNVRCTPLTSAFIRARSREQSRNVKARLQCDFWCDFAYKTRLTLPCMNVFFAKHRVNWKESYHIIWRHPSFQFPLYLEVFCRGVTRLKARAG